MRQKAERWAIYEGRSRRRERAKYGRAKYGRATRGEVAGGGMERQGRGGLGG